MSDYSDGETYPLGADARDSSWYVTSAADPVQVDENGLQEIDDPKSLLLHDIQVHERSEFRIKAIFGRLNLERIALSKRGKTNARKPESDHNVSEEAKRVFLEAAEQWKRDTKLTSSVTEIVANPHHMRIVGLGKEALPLIFNDLKESGGQWFVALSSITGENPIEPEDAGRMKRMTESWLAWGREHGY